MPTQNIPNGWKKVKLGEVVEYISRGISPKYSDSGIIVINQRCIRDEKVDFSNVRFHSYEKNISSEKIVKKYDILINSTGVGTLGRVAQIGNVNKLITVDSHVTICRIKNKYDKKFIGFVLRSKQKEIESLGKGATGQTELSRNELKNLDILLPPLPVQRKVASILSAYDDLIENNNKRIKILESMGKAIFDDMMKQAEEKGELEEVKAENLGIFKNGINYNKNSKGEKFRIINVKNIVKNKFIYSSFLDTIEIEKKKAENYILENLDIIIARSASPGEVSLFFDIYENKTIYSGFTINFRLSNKDLAYYIFYFLHNYKEKIFNFSNGTIFKNVNQQILKDIKVPIPSQQTLQNFNNQIKPILDKILNLQLQNQNLKQTRDLLIPRLVSGKLEVEEMKVK